MPRKPFYFFIVFLIILFFLLERSYGIEFSPEEQNWLNRTESLRFSEVDWEPLSYASDYPEYKGLIADYMEILSAVSGIEFQFVQSRTWADVLNKYSRGDIDLIPAISLDDMVEAEILLTEPYISFPLVIVTRRDIDFINSTEELEGLLVGVGEGYTSHNFLKNEHPEIELVPTDDVREGLKLLQKGRIDAFVGHLAVVTAALKEFRNTMHIAGKTEYTFEHRMGVSSGNKAAVSVFNKIFQSITPEEHNRIYNKWIRINRTSVDYSLVWKILIGSLFIITFSILWNIRINRLVGELRRLKNELEEKNQKLNTQAVTDQLTGLYNRIRLDEALNSEMARQVRYNHVFGLVLMDVDHFKKVNDIYGHTTGDRVLVCLSRLLQANVRKTDTLGRWGGEEFLLICPDVDEQSLRLLAEKLRKRIEEYNFPGVRHCTVSFGASLFRKDESLTQLLERTDKALYKAKENGRNQVILY